MKTWLTCLLFSSCTIRCSSKASHASEADNDVLLRGSKQRAAMERIHREAINTRLSEVTKAGTFDTSVNLGYRPEVRSPLHASDSLRQVPCDWS